MSTEIRTTTCYMCACRCGIRVHLKDGAVRYIDGNPEHPVNRGVICAKGASGIMKQVSPARLTLPLALIAAGWLALAFCVQFAGLLAERWYFFAEARHPQNLYYQSMS